VGGSYLHFTVVIRLADRCIAFQRSMLVHLANTYAAPDNSFGGVEAPAKKEEHMRQADQESPAAPSTLAPIQVERPSDEQDLAGMRGRRGPRIVIALAVLAAVGFGGVLLLRSMDARQVYAQAAAQLERSQSEQLEAFVRCALPNRQSAQFAAQTGLQSALEIATSRMGKTYAKVVTKCTPLLQNFQRSVATIQAPADAAPSLHAVSKAANDFATAWLGLRDFMQSSVDYEPAEATPRIQAITASWQTYQSERVRAKELLSAQL
jgi:hypothetical protein